MTRQGAVLIEVLAAFTILSVAGLTSLEFLTTMLDSQSRLVDRELEIRRAERLLVATTLLTEDELLQRLGVRTTDEFLVWVGRPERFLYRVGISPIARPEVELLATLVYRRSPEIDDEP
jgi:hypothetical protein